jgi:SAM-dependent methyltransferase
MKKILNVGCGIDDYGTHFVDLFPQRKDVIQCDLDIQKLPFPSNYFDEVYSKNLFEHLTNLGFASKEMHRVLKKNGKLILITDNANFFGFSVGKTHLGGYEEARKLWGRKSINKDRHYELFTDWHLRNYAKKVGFKMVKTEYILEESENRNNLIGIKGQMVKFSSLLLRNTPLKRAAYNLIKLEAVK